MQDSSCLSINIMASIKYEKQVSGISLPSLSDSELTHDRMRPKGLSMRKNIGRAFILLTSLAGILVGFNGLLRLHKNAWSGIIDSIWDALNHADAFHHAHSSFTSQPAHALCPQVSELLPEKNKLLWDAVGVQLGSGEFKKQAIAWLGGAIRIP